MVELKIGNGNFEDLAEMELDKAKEIIGDFEEKCGLEDVAVEYNGKKYGVDIIQKGDWIDDGKHKHKKDIGILCKYNENWEIEKRYNIAVTQNISWTGSYYSEYRYEYSQPEMCKIIKK